jgi:predicted thioesterase
MLDKIQIGLSSIIETVTTPKDSVINYNSGDIDVFATPAMIALMECTAKNAVDLHLPMGFTTVGTRLDVKHMAATPIGMKVKFTAELIEIEGKRLIFKIEAYDEVEKIGEGLHERYIIEIDNFMNKINKKITK